jgi:DNA-binding transcriptional regulator YbjK
MMARGLVKPAPATLPQAERRRRAILDATLRVISAGGVDAVTHRRIAAEAGVALGSTTYYFASREELVRQAFRHYLEEVTAALGSLGREKPLESAEAIAELLTEVARREFAEPALVLAEYELVLYAARDPVLAQDWNAYERGIEAQLAGPLENLGADRPVDAARTVIELMRGFELGRLTRPSASIEDLRRHLELVICALTSSRPAGGA